jgi:predicted acyl esterase
VAQLDVYALRYAWFDHVLNGAPKPALLQGRINYQLMGANLWKHASSFDAIGSGQLRLHLAPGTGATHRLAAAPASTASMELVVDLADRSDADWLPPFLAVIPQLDTHNAVAFMTEPLLADTDVTGVLRAALEFDVNKKDFDLVMRVYEALADGTYLELGRPYVQRMGYLRDRSRRQLLKPGTRQKFEVTKPGLIARRVKAGNRLVLVLGVQKQRDAQINYVSDEAVADAGEPLRIRWYSGSSISFPVLDPG